MYRVREIVHREDHIDEKERVDLFPAALYLPLVMMEEYGSAREAMDATNNAGESGEKRARLRSECSASTGTSWGLVVGLYVQSISTE